MRVSKRRILLPSVWLGSLTLALGVASAGCSNDGPEPTMEFIDVSVEVFPAFTTRAPYSVLFLPTSWPHFSSPKLTPAPPQVLLDALGRGTVYVAKTHRHHGIAVDAREEASTIMLPDFYGSLYEVYANWQVLDDASVCANLLSTLIHDRTLVVQGWSQDERGRWIVPTTPDLETNAAATVASRELLTALGIETTDPLRFNDVCLSDGDSEATQILVGLTYVLMQAYGVLDNGEFEDDAARFRLNLHELASPFALDGTIAAEKVAWLKHAAWTLDAASLEADFAELLVARDAEYSAPAFSAFLETFGEELVEGDVDAGDGDDDDGSGDDDELGD